MEGSKQKRLACSSAMPPARPAASGGAVVPHALMLLLADCQLPATLLASVPSAASGPQLRELFVQSQLQLTRRAGFTMLITCLCNALLLASTSSTLQQAAAPLALAE